MSDIVLCAGHKQTSQGAVNKKYSRTEYAESMMILPHLVVRLQDAGHTVQIVAGSLSHKIAQINEIKPDLALDFHFNADYDHLDPDDNDDSRGRGAMVMYCPQNSIYGARDDANYLRKRQADAFSAAMAEVIGNRDLGGRQGWWWNKLNINGKPIYRDAFVLKTCCAALIPELGYIDNNKFAKDWLVAGRYEEMAEALYAGIVATLAV